MTAADPRDGLVGLVAKWRDPESPPLNQDQLRQAIRNGARLDCADDLEQALAHARPEVVDEAMARRLDDYLGGEFDIRIGKQAAHAALIAALTPERAP